MPFPFTPAVEAGLKAAVRLASGSAKRLDRRLDRLRLGQTPPSIGDALSDAHTTGWVDVRCAFALSTGRAGSKTVTALWALSPGVYAVHEPLPRLIEVSGRAWQDPAEPSLRTAVYAARDDLVANTWRRGLVWAETNNRLTSLAPALASAFPAARFVHLWRDPEAFIASGLARRWYAGHHWDFARWVPRSDDEVAAVWPSLPLVDRIAWLWAATNAFLADFAAAQPSRCVTLSAAALFRGDTDALASVYQVVDALPPPQEAVARILSKQMNAGVGTTGQVGPWFDGLAPLVRAQVESVADCLGAHVR